MQTQTGQTEQAGRKEVVFDENGQTVEVVAEIEESGAPEADPVAEEARAAAEAAAAPKFKIGDREFATESEALGYAQSQISALSTESQVSDAYRQGIRDAISQNPAPVAEVVAPPALNTEKLYTNPQEFLTEYAQKIKNETMSEFNQVQSVKAQSDQIWREFTDRHPEMADFRTEVETFVQANTTDVRGIIATKGRPASYDFIATKLKSHFERYANSLKPKRELSNAGGGPSPAQKAAGVTLKPDVKKSLSFAEQIRSIKKRR